MIKKLLLACGLLVSLLSAETKMEYQISLVDMQMNYKEYDRAGDLLDSEKSSFSDVSGAEFKCRYLLDEYASIDFAAMSLKGNTEYVGAYIGSGLEYGSVVSSTTNTVRDISLGYHAKNMSDLNIMMLGGIGIGYRYWQRELSASQIEEYTWYSLRGNIGVEKRYGDFKASVLVEYQYGIYPRMSATDIGDDFKLSSANIVKLSIPLRYTLSKNLALSCAYVFEYQKIKESNVVYDAAADGYVEPDSKAYNQYLKIGLILKY